jgi:deoxyribose-phosphate aldolase
MCKYTPERVASTIDLAVLKPEATQEDVILACQKAIRFGCASVCVKSCYTNVVAKQLDDYDPATCCVLNFPHGNSSPDVMALEAYNAIGDGAEELDMVMNIGKARDEEWEYVADGIQAVVEIAHEWNALVKVILETCYLMPWQTKIASRICANHNADWVKTSTGYGSGGATPDAVILMRDTVNGKCQVKASGGIRTYKDAETYLELGCTRLGSSRVEELLPCEPI